MTAAVLLTFILIVVTCRNKIMCIFPPRQPDCGQYALPACPRNLDEVCGMDGRIYSNECMLCFENRYSSPAFGVVLFVSCLHDVSCFLPSVLHCSCFAFIIFHSERSAQVMIKHKDICQTTRPWQTEVDILVQLNTFEKQREMFVY